jgi:hypothetical protein
MAEDQVVGFPRAAAGVVVQYASPRRKVQTKLSL